jgi:hypothetical protein
MPRLGALHSDATGPHVIEMSLQLLVRDMILDRLSIAGKDVVEVLGPG